MIKKDELKKLSVAELKKMADTKKVKYTAKIKKDDLIKLILGVDEVVKSANKVKETLTDNPSSKIEQDNKKQPQNDFFQNIPELPKDYNKNKLVLMVRDPHWGFAYWEVANSTEKEFDLKTRDLTLRIYDITTNGDPAKSDSYFDIKLNKDATNWYIKFPLPNRNFIVDYGYMVDGKFITVIRSNAVATPRDEISDQVDEEWMMTDEQFKAILKASGANQMFEQVSSQELVKFISGNVGDTDTSNSGNSSTLASSPSSPFGSLL